MSRVCIIGFEGKRFILENLAISGCEVRQSISEFDVVFFDVSWPDSVVVWCFLFEFVLVIGLVAGLILIAEDDVVEANVFGPDGFLLAFDLVVLEFLFKLWLVSCCADIIFVANAEIVFLTIFVGLLKVIEFMMGIFWEVFWLLFGWKLWINYIGRSRTGSELCAIHWPTTFFSGRMSFAYNFLSLYFITHLYNLLYLYLWTSKFDKKIVVCLKFDLIAHGDKIHVFFFTFLSLYHFA